VSNANNFVSYPTQAGYFYQWGYSKTVGNARPYPPHTYDHMGGAWENEYTNVIYTLDRAIPSGYSVPTYSSVMEADLINGDVEVIGGWGYYADGWFDRREIRTPAGLLSVNNSAVSVSNAQTAYSGNLVYNKNTNASLFFPAAGHRRWGAGVLHETGAGGYYWSKSPSNTAGTSYFMNFTDGKQVNIDNFYKSYGMSIRCIKN
jgi:hypothetical protein